VDEPIRHAALDAHVVRKMRALSAAEGIALAAGLTDLAIALGTADGSRRPRFWRPTPSTMS
jgi:hypothetical protein